MAPNEDPLFKKI